VLPQIYVHQIRTLVGGIDSNSYLDFIEAEDYFSADVYFLPVWKGMDEEAQISWLRLSARMLDRFGTYLGNRQYQGQALEFPRYPVLDEIPQAIKHAQAELLIFLVNNKTSASALDTREVSEMSVLNGLLKLEYSGAKDHEAERVGGGSINTVRLILKDWLSPTVRWARG
jgi:hypothetical protein